VDSPPRSSPKIRWSDVRVWIEDPGARAHSAREVSRRRSIVALGGWRVGLPPANCRFVHVDDAKLITNPAEVDWTGFPPPVE
jgi:hypothetical protein